MLLNTSGYEMKIQKRINYNKTTDPVCRVKNDTIKKNECDLYSNRPEVTVINGTLIINRVIRADSGNYTVTLYHSDGTDTSTHLEDLEVNVEAPIGSVEVSIICSSSGVMRASCSSEGDQLLYSWTLNGDSLTDGNSSIDLNEGTDGNITCSVKNHVSHGQKTINVKPCPVSVVFVLVWCFQMMGLFGLLGGFHIYMRHTSGLDRFCRFNQSDPCYAALGHKLNVLMLLDTSEYDMKIQKRINYNKITDPVCRVKNDTMKKNECDLYSNRPEVTGDQLLYSWTLNGDSLMHGNSSIGLNEGTDENITCSVKNHREKAGDSALMFITGPTTAAVTSSLTSAVISSTHTSEYDTMSVVFVLVWCFQMMGLFGLLGGFHIYMRHTSGERHL
ncbi:HEPACAM family member 2 [Labeo rohita]|uniref:HEPACAM family member 2 n=1 Tax=Labeo rohita TaxID=84645 RepID=A0ABQ8L7N5_LABRO|nr:HEPACAM family member 2 [Labeo rohita]